MERNNPAESDNSNNTQTNKRQKIDDSNNDDPVDFLNFDYDFSLNPNVVDGSGSSANVGNDNIHNQDMSDGFFLFTEAETMTNPDDILALATDSNSVLNPTVAVSAGAPSPTTVSSPALQQQQQTATQQQTILTSPQQPQQPRVTQQQRQQAINQATLSDPPNHAVFTIVVGSKPFRLSWESLKSDGPTNFFTDFFRKKKHKVMQIDRDPDIFELIVQHLRGYYIRPKDDIENQSLLYDATYYGLNRLKMFLREYIYINIGGRVFRLPWELFRKDGTHNFFTGPLMHSLLSPHAEEEGNGLPLYIDKDPDLFADIINHIRGYTIHIRDETHRKNLLKDAQYYAFRQLSDKLLTAQQTVAGIGEGHNPEVLLMLQDLRLVNILPSKAIKSGQSLTLSEMVGSKDWCLTQLQFKRVVNGPPHALLVQVSDLCMQIHRANATVAERGDIKLKYEMSETDMKKMKGVAQVAKASGGVNTEIFLDNHCAITIDDSQVNSLQYCIDNNVIETNWEECKEDKDCELTCLVLQRAICGVHIIDNKVTLCALRLEAISSRFRLNLNRQFLP